MPAGPLLPFESITAALDRWRVGARVEVLRTEFLDVLASVPARRSAPGLRYPLAGLAIAVLGFVWRVRDLGARGTGRGA